MQNLEHDMEDLLRRASEAYPLKRGEDKWDEISSKISANPADKQELRNKKYYAVPVLLVFLLLSFLVVNDGEDQNNSVLQKTKKYTSQLTSQTINTKNKEKLLLENSAPDKNLSLIKSLPIVVNFSTGNGERVLDNKESADISGMPERANNIAFPGAENNNYKKSTIKKNDLTVTDFETPLSEKESFSSKTELSLEQYRRLKQIMAVHSDKKSIHSKITKRGFYYGVTSGIDINAIKDQGFKRPGFRVGLLVGYRFSSSLSFESGLSFSEKSYWTSGKYFKMDEMGATMPSGTEMIEVHGSSRILEFPIHLRYDLPVKNNHLFLSAGFSSFILTGENNRYHILLNGSDGKMYGSYQKDKGYVAATIDFGIGYEKTLGKKTHIRFEPYLQLPVRGIGVGHLPLKSTGLLIGLTRSIH